MVSASKIGIIVLNYNGGRYLLSCLASLAQLDYPNKEIVVVDNASEDGSLVEAEKRFPQLTFVRNQANEGFAKGMNIGMRMALAHGARACLLFNNDATLDPHALTALVEASERHPEAGLLCPIIYESGSERPWFEKGKIDFFRMRAVHLRATKAERLSDAYASGYLTGCALFIKRELIDAIGFLDERFFLYYEDADYSFRASRAGFACLVVPGARVWHSEASRSNPQKTYFLVYSGLLFFQKHASLLMRPYLAAYVTIRRVKNHLDRLRGRGGAAEDVHRAYEHFFSKR